ncbi:D-alanine--D-alanine ligase B [bacterium HR40]|nr:D-alanine--D-alanine ligase B [bacterium HR40]
MTHVAVLMGGMSAEREVSLISGEACARALERRGFRVTRIDAGRDLAVRLAEVRPDVVFNALHGRYGEDGRVQGLLDLMGLPYTHSGVLASAIAMHKPTARALFERAGLRVPEGRVMRLVQLLEEPPFPVPFVVKPPAEGSSVGVVIVRDPHLEELRARNDLDPAAEILVERYIAGRELTCAVLGDRALAVTEIAPREGFYDYRAKYTPGVAEHILPAPLPSAIERLVLAWSETAHRALGCRGVSRADFRWDDRLGEEGLFILELNTQPGMTPMSLLPEQAAYCGIAFEDLVVRLVEEARCDS